MKPVRKTNMHLRNAAAVRRYRAANLQRVLECGRRTDDKRYAKRREDPQKVRDYIKVWRTKNIDRERMRSRVNMAIRRASERGVYDATDIAAMYDTQNGKCAVSWCRTGLSERFEIDHILALSRGGSSKLENLQLLCRTCNRSKKNMSMFEFYLRKVGGNFVRL